MPQLPHAKWLVRLVLIAGISLLLYHVILAGKIGKGDHIPRFSLKTLNNQSISSEDLLGRPLFILFWGHWCSICVHELPQIEDLQRKIGHQLRIIAIHQGDTPKDREILLKLKETLKLSYNIYMEGGTVSSEFGVNMVPTVFVVDKNGMVLERVAGVHDWVSKFSADDGLRKLLNTK